MNRTFLLLAPVLAGIVAVPRFQPRQATGGDEALVRARDRAAAWLVDRQDASGAFLPERPEGPGALLVSSTALWALCEARPEGFAYPDALRCSAWIFRHRQPDGGIYDPRLGHGAYESSAARIALLALQAWQASEQVGDFVTALSAYLETQATAVLCGVDPIGSQLGALERIQEELPEHERKAVRFLQEARSGNSPGEDWLSVAARRARKKDLKARAPLNAFSPFSSDDVRVQGARLALAQSGPEDHRFLVTFADARLVEGTPDLFHALLVGTRVLRSLDDDPSSATWKALLAERLLPLQAADGSFRSPTGASWQADPTLATAMGLLALELSLRP